MRKLIFLHDQFDYRGGGEQMLMRAARQAAEQAEVSLGLFWGEGSAMTPEERAVFHKIESFDFPGSMKPQTFLKHRRAMANLNGWIRKINPSAVMAFSLRPAVRAAQCSAVKSRAFAWMCQQSFPLFEPPLAPLKEWLGLRALRSRKTRIVCIANEARKEFRKRGFRAGDMTLIRNGIDVAKFSQARATAAEKRAAKEALGLDPEIPAAVCVARLDPIKNHETLLRGLHALIRRGRRCQLICVGGEAGGAGEYSETIHGLAEQLGLSDLIHWAGEQPDTLPYLSAADVKILPSVKEAAGLVLAEAGAARLPLIGSRRGGIPEIVRPGKTGWLFDAEQPEELADALEKLLKNPVEARKMGMRAALLVDKEFNHNRQNEKWEAFIAKLSD